MRPAAPRTIARVESRERRLLAAVLFAVALVSAAALHAQDEQRSRIPRLGPPPPLDPRFLQRFQGSIRTTIDDVAFRTALGQRVRFDRLEIVMDPEAVGTDAVHARLIRIVRPQFISPVDTISTPLDVFVEIPGPHTTIDRLLIEDGRFGTEAHPSQYEGQWLWLAEGVDVEVRDIVMGGDLTASARLVSARAEAELKGRPILLRHASATVRRTATAVDVDADIGLADSDIEVDGTLLRSGDYRAELRTAPLAFADARTFMPELPDEGTAEIDATVSRAGSSLDIALRDFLVRARASTIAATGEIRTGQDGAVRNFVLSAPRVVPADLDSLFGLSIPGEGVWSGRIRADGPLTGVTIDGSLEHATALPASSATAAGDEYPRVAFAGTAAFTDDSAFDARLTFEPVALDALPLPAALESVHGTMLGEVEIRGTVDDIDVSGTVDLREAGFSVPAARLSVSDLAGPITVRDGVADLGGLAGRANGGTIDVDGTARLFGGNRTVDVTVAAEDVILASIDTARVFADAQIVARGPLLEPLISAEARAKIARPAGELPLATFGGTLDVARGGALDFVLRADSMRLEALPIPAAVRDVRGAVTGSLRIGGTLDAPTTDGRFELHGIGGTIDRTGTTLRDLRGVAAVHDGTVALEGVRGAVGGGELTVDGEARLTSTPRTVAARLTIDRGLIADTDSMQIVASAEITARGELPGAVLGGTVTLHEGWVHEDNFARNPPIDTAAPPYAEMIARVPWIADSRLRSRAAPGDVDAASHKAGDVAKPAVTGQVAIDIERGLRLIDEDSEIRGTGRIVVSIDSAGARADGLYRMTDGFYAQYGAVFEIRGGAFVFAGDFSPTVTMRSEHRFETPLGIWLTPGTRLMDRFPPLHFFALGTQAVAGREVRRLSLLPESRTELGALLLYDEKPQPVTGMRPRAFWPPDDGGGVFGESSATRGIVLVANYIANESYDYLPLERAYLRAGVIEVGPTRPGRITIGPYLQGGVHLGGLRAVLTQPVEGGTAPGIRVHYRVGAPELIAFSEPRFLSTAPLLPGGAVFTHGRRSGVGVRWVWER